MRCLTCDELMPDDAIFCPNCGERMVQVSSAGLQTTLLPAPQPERPSTYRDAERPFAPPPPIQPPQEVTPAPIYRVPPAVGAYPVSVPNSGLALASMILGILGWTILPVIGPMVAVLLGHMAQREIRAARGALSGSGMAVAGLVLGYLQLVPLVLGLCFLVLLFGGIVGFAL